MKIQDILNQAKPCWKYAAMEPGGGWYLYKNKPRLGKTCATWIDDISPVSPRALYDLEPIFDIEPFDGDWKDSLICKEEIEE